MECPIEKRFAPYALTVIRLALGIIFFMHGAQKVLGLFGGQGLTATVQGMTGMGLPAALAYLVCFGEFLGGTALILGLLFKPAALGIMIIMIGAIATVHGKNGFFSSNGGYEYNLALIAMCLGLIFGGPGRMAVDNYWCCKKKSGIEV